MIRRFVNSGQDWSFLLPEPANPALAAMHARRVGGCGWRCHWYQLVWALDLRYLTTYGAYLLLS